MTKGDGRDPAADSLPRLAAFHAVMAAGSALAVAMVIALACWIVASNGTGSASQAFAAGVIAVLGACHGGTQFGGAPVDFVPLGATLFVALPCWRAGAVLGAAAGRDLPQRERLLTLARAAGVFGGVMAVLALIVHIGDNRADRIWTGPWAFALFAAAAAVPYARATAPTLSHGEVSALAVIGRAAAAGLAVLLGGGAVLAGGAFMLNAGQARELSQIVGGGGASGLPLAVIGILCVPNAVIAAMAYLAGPGFVVGAGTTVSATTTAVGAIPAFPLLAAMPERHGAAWPVIALMVVVPLLAGGAIVVVLWRQLPYPGVAALVLGALGAAAGIGACAAVLCWLGGGALGSGRLAEVGAPALAVGLRTAGQVGAASLLALAALGLWQLVQQRSESGGGSGVAQFVARVSTVRAGEPATDADDDASRPGAA